MDSPTVFLEVCVALESESHFFVDLSGDMAHVGIFIATWRDIPVGRKVVIGSHLPDGRILVTGRVRWLRDAQCETGPGIGVALEGLTDDDVARIAHFCDARPPFYYEVEAA
jgi:Tfp pilus assembly protein PilZ